MVVMDMDRLKSTIQNLERRLASPAMRLDPEVIGHMLADDFMEIGASGRSFNKAEILELLASETDFTAYDIEDFAVRSLGEDSVLATYRIPPRPEADGTPRPGSMRSSLWQMRDGRWQLVFHQGTRMAP